MQFLRGLSAGAESSIPAFFDARTLPCRSWCETRVNSRRHHASHDEGVTVPVLAFLRRLSAGVSAGCLPRQWYSFALGQPGPGERSLPELGGLPHDRGKSGRVRVPDLRVARWRAVASVLLQLAAGA